MTVPCCTPSPGLGTTISIGAPRSMSDLTAVVTVYALTAVSPDATA